MLFFAPSSVLEGAACRDLPEEQKRWFFTSPAKAKAICKTCPVTMECLERALLFESVPGEGRHGVWGGLTRGERRQIFGA